MSREQSETDFKIEAFGELTPIYEGAEFFVITDSGSEFLKDRLTASKCTGNRELLPVGF